MKTKAMTNKTFTTDFYGTGQFWFFDNGLFAEKLEIMQKDHYEIMIDEVTGKEYGLYHWKSNNTGNSHFGGSLFPISCLSDEILEIYNSLK